MKNLFGAIVFALFLGCNANAQQPIEYSFQIKFKSESAASQIISSRADLNFIRVIPFASNSILEQRHRDAGLHLWYRVEVKDNKTVDAEVRNFSLMEGVRYAKHTEYIKINEYKDVDETAIDSEYVSSKKISRITNVVNDPLYNMQWHYSNTECANINLEHAWALEQGKRNVIVAVMDGWIDYTHPDLADNMWVNEIELNGIPGVDDDGNGYVDDIHGLNLLDNYEFSNHGTHIAGTIAAVNNNGIGVCGVAGGNGIDTGAKVMSICVNSETNFVSNWLMAQAYVYAADNGAVISSNSWRGEDLPSPIIKEGIKYFMQYAGLYDGSPMNGGLVVFAAGNDNSNIAPSPINDFDLRGDNLIVVAATGQTGMRASFSNYGTWVDIAAPGGDFDGKGVFSTYPGDKYGFMNGTSMACPHVSGVAALVVSKYANRALTPQKVKQILKNTATPINPLQAGYPYIEQMGSGIIDAHQAVAGFPEANPDCPKDFKVICDQDNNYLFSWEMPADANGNPVSECAIYANNSKIPMVKVKTTGTPVGEMFSYYVNGKTIEGTDTFSIEAIDFWGNNSNRSELVEAQKKSEQNWVYNPYGTTNITLYKPDKNYIRPLPINSPKFPYAISNGYKIVVEEPNGIVANVMSVNHEVTFDLKTDENTPLGTFPLIIKIVKADDESVANALEMTYTVHNPLKNITGPQPENPEDMHFYSTDLKGVIDLNIRDYIYEPLGLDFTIPDYSYVLDWDPLLVSMSYTIENDMLHVEYEFDEDGVGYDPDPLISIPFSAINSYFVDSKLQFYIHYVEMSGIYNVNSNPYKNSKGIYTITGVKIDKPVEKLIPGFYIIDGKKVFIRK